jgi:hypothetical protein
MKNTYDWLATAGGSLHQAARDSRRLATPVPALGENNINPWNVA